MAIKAIYAAIALASLSTAAVAQESDAYRACAAETDAAARLACFDRVHAARFPTSSAPGTSPATAAAPANAAARSSAPNKDIGLDARQARKERAARGETEPAPPAAIVATVVKVITITPLIAAFELSNGQVWEQSESMKFSAEPQQTVTIRSGLLGAFFLKNAAGLSVRVHRVQ